MKLYCHSVLTSNRVGDNKLIKNACVKILLNIFFQAQNGLREEAEKIINFDFKPAERKEIKEVLFKGREGGNSRDWESLKDTLREKAVEKYSKTHRLNLTKTSREYNINITRIQKELGELEKKVFIFNFINRKKSHEELISGVITSTEFIQEERETIFLYMIPREILNFLIFPDQYAPVDMDIIKNLKYKYSIKFYLLLLDHKKRGILELSKKELIECFSLPESYCRNRQTFLKKFLLPILDEMEKVANLKVEYTFTTPYSLKGIILKIKREKIVFSQAFLEKIDFAKRNIHIKKAWNPRIQDFLMEYCRDNGEDMGRKLLQRAYETLSEPIRNGLHNYLFVISKKLQVDTQIEELQEESQAPAEKNEVEDRSWRLYQSFCHTDQKIYRNLARLRYQEVTGNRVIHEEFFNASFKSLVKEILEF